MATSKDFAEYVLDQIGDEQARVRAMFGEYALYFEDKVVGLICNETLFIKITENTKSILGDNPTGSAYLGSKDFYIINEDILESHSQLRDLVVACSKDIVKKK